MVAFVSACCRIGRAHVCSSHLVISYAVFCLKKKTQKRYKRKSIATHSTHVHTGPVLGPACSHPVRFRESAERHSAPRSHPFVGFSFFFNDRPPTDFHPLPQHHALHI